MKEFDASERAKAFNERRKECSQAIRDVLDFLRTVAEHVDTHVDPPTFEVRGVGITYWSRGRRFCRFDPKLLKHVQALVPAADLVELKAAGLEFTRSATDGPWVLVKSMRDAVRLVPLIVLSYEAAAHRSATRR